MPRKANVRAARGMGTIRKRVRTNKNGSAYEWWEGRVTTCYDEDGKQIQRTVTGKSQAEVAKAIREIEASLDSNTYVAPDKITVNEWLTEWKETYLVNVKPSTKAVYMYDVEKYIVPRLGHQRLQGLTKPIVQRFVNDLKAAGLSAKSVKDIHGVLHRALEDAIDAGIILQNPSNKIKLPKVVKRDPYIPEMEEIARFLAAITGRKHERVYRVQLYVGTRISKALGFTWDQVDFKRGTIAVNKQLTRERKQGGQYFMDTTKDYETRVITLPDSILAVLREQRIYEDEKRILAGDKWQDLNLIFSNDTGGYLSYRTVYDCFKRRLKKAGISDIRLHDLRHAYCTLALDNGDDIKTIQNNLGHSTPELTLRIYAHSTDEMKANSAKRMDERIKTLEQMV